MIVTVVNCQHAIAVPQRRLRDLVARTARQLNLSFPEIIIVFVSAARMRRINKNFLGHDYATDVITFMHGEILICPQVAKAQAKVHGNRLSEEILLYAVHGCLHLAGYDDRTKVQKEQMRAMEKAMLR